MKKSLTYLTVFAFGLLAGVFFGPALNFGNEAALLADANGVDPIPGVVTKNIAIADRYLIEFEIDATGQHVYVLPNRHLVTNQHTEIVIIPYTIMEYGGTSLRIYEQVGP